MTKNFILFILITGIVFLVSCKKDTDIFVADKGEITGPDTSWYNTLTAAMPVTALKSSLAISPDIDSFEVAAASAATITSASGLQLVLPADGCVTPGNQQVSGMVQMQSLLLKRKGDLIRMGTPTVTDNKLLVSGGAFYVGLKKDGAKLQLASGSNISVKYAAASPNNQMQLFNADQSGTDHFSWIANYDLLNNLVVATSDAYEITSNKLNWVHCGRLYDNLGASTIIDTDMPVNFTNSSTIVYLVFNNINTVTGLYGTASSGKFSSMEVPVGQAATVVVISKQGDYYYLGTKAIVTATPALGSNTQTVSINPVKTSLDGIKNYLGTL